MDRDEEMAEEIERAIEPLAGMVEKLRENYPFEKAYDEAHLRLMELLDKYYRKGLEHGHEDVEMER